MMTCVEAHAYFQDNHAYRGSQVPRAECVLQNIEVLSFISGWQATAVSEGQRLSAHAASLSLVREIWA